MTGRLSGDERLTIHIPTRPVFFHECRNKLYEMVSFWQSLPWCLRFWVITIRDWFLNSRRYQFALFLTATTAAACVIISPSRIWVAIYKQRVTAVFGRARPLVCSILTI